MATFNIDAAKLKGGEEASVSIMNGAMQQCVQEAYDAFRTFEDNSPAGEVVNKNFLHVQDMFNDEFKPRIKTINEKLNQLAGIALAIESADFGSVAPQADFGNVASKQYKPFDAL